MKDKKVHMLQRVFGNEIPSGECSESDFVMRLLEKDERVLEASLNGDDVTKKELSKYSEYEKEFAKFLFTEDLREVTCKKCFKRALEKKKDTMTNKKGWDI